MKKCRQKHGGFSRHMTPFPRQLVPPAHEITTDYRLNSEPAAIFTPPPWFYQKYFCFSKFLQQILVVFLYFFRLLTIGSKI